MNFLFIFLSFRKNKTKAYLALHALEIDLSSLAELQK